MKRIMDILVSFFGLLVFSPILIVTMVLIWLQDYHSPFYIPFRVGKGEKKFKMYKLRSMIVNADKSKVDSTSNDDARITKVGHFIRACKLDEIMQLFNVFLGSMSLVGPRPNVERETNQYSAEEKLLLTVRPGITDFSSIVFSDEGDILEGSDDPDIDYHQLIRPWKSKLGIFYIQNRSLLVDIKLVVLTAILIFSRKTALRAVSNMLKEMNAPEELYKVALRQEKLIPTIPPGFNKIITERIDI